jgi:GNAT superfamily N-acetyltransferase
MVPDPGAPAPVPVIRPASRDDVPAILDFIRQLAAFERLEAAVEATEDALRETLFGERPAAEVRIATIEGRDVGFALFFGTYSTFLARRGLYLEDLFVVPDARGRGVGRALLTHLAEEALRRDCGRLEWSVLTWNSPAVDFYRRLGAFSLDEWQTFRLNREGLLALAGPPPPRATDD